MSPPLLQVEGVSKRFGTVVALREVSLSVLAGQVTCLLGDNGAGKSTLIQILAGVHRPSEGRCLVDGQPVELASPRDALRRGIATVYQDLAMIPLLGIWRNFFLGAEPCSGWGPFRRIDVAHCERVVREELGRLGVRLRDPAQPVGTLSGGERQAVAIARAMYFGARVLVLDEPTAALGVKQAAVVLRYIINARERGVGVVLVTHNPHHAYPVGDRFVILRRGGVQGDYGRRDIRLEELIGMMAGGEELERLAAELGPPEGRPG
ncbi:MAG: sugar ABC transporter ATP-binding protein [Gemmatimonadales bacterium]|nr:sugar ABC transporter ATP-binding protein [Gemmatimonadales bacterium]